MSVLATCAQIRQRPTEIAKNWRADPFATAQHAVGKRLPCRMATGVDNKSPSYFLRRSNDGVCVMGGEGEWRDRSRCGWK